MINHKKILTYKFIVGLMAFLLIATPGSVFGNEAKDKKAAISGAKQYLNLMHQSKFKKAYASWHPSKKNPEAKKGFERGARNFGMVFMMNQAMKKYVRSINRIKIDGTKIVEPGKIQVNYSLTLPGNEMFDVFEAEMRVMAKQEKGMNEKTPPAKMKKFFAKVAKKVSSKIKKMATRQQPSALIMAKHKSRYYYLDRAKP